ncbi:MAG: tyrosine-type recombinase/integrase [Acidobacteria bacterium]|nr:tyrosine-type recombinase/integrase [Acidobacteriota bacterium]
MWCLPHGRIRGSVPVESRHSHASQLLRAGVSPKLISERLGHSKVGFTLDVYSHLLPGMQEEAAHLVDVGLRAAMEKAQAPVM